MKTNGNPALQGSSWGWASNNLQVTIDRASAGDVVFVAAGVYYGGFVMKEGVNVRGGYTANDSNPTERYPMTDADSSHYSILDGNGLQRTLTQLAPFSTPTTWDGFVIRNGNPAVAFKTGSVVYSQADDNAIIGVLYRYDPDTESGKMIGTAEIQKQWGGYESTINGLPPLIDRSSAKENVSGQENSEKILVELGQASVDFSMPDDSGNGNYAAYWCDTLTIGDFSDWYLPSAGELHEVFEANIQPVLKSVGKNLKYPFWTSGQVGNTLAWAYCFGNDYCHPALKYVAYTVSAIHDFTLPEQPDGIYFAGGGAFLCANGVLNNCIVRDNVSASKGGGVYVGKGGQLIDCRVEGNLAPEAPEIYYEAVSKINKTGVQTFSVYPNPVQAGKEMTIDCASPGSFDYRITDISGRTLTAGKLHAGQTIPAPLQKGMCILSLQSKEITVAEKIIIN